MIVDLLFLLLPKFVAGLYLGGVVGIYYRMLKRKHVHPWIYFALGIGGYNFLSYLTWGWLRQFEIAMATLCCIGMAVAFLGAMYRLRREEKQLAAERKILHDTIAQMDAARIRYDAFFQGTFESSYQPRQKDPHTPTN